MKFFFIVALILSSTGLLAADPEKVSEQEFAAVERAALIEERNRIASMIASKNAKTTAEGEAEWMTARLNEVKRDIAILDAKQTEAVQEEVKTQDDSHESWDVFRKFN